MCVLHAGTHKTGTTSIQALLTQNAEILADEGIYVPRAGRARRFLGSDYVGHHNIAWELNGDARFDRGEGTLADLLVETAAVSQRVVVITSEDFEYLHANPQALRKLALAFDARGV